MTYRQLLDIVQKKKKNMDRTFIHTYAYFHQACVILISFYFWRYKIFFFQKVRKYLKMSGVWILAINYKTDIFKG